MGNNFLKEPRDLLGALRRSSMDRWNGSYNVLPYSESYSEETKYILVKVYKFSCIQEYY